MKSFRLFSILSLISSAVLSVAFSVGAFAREVMEVAFPAHVPRDLIVTTPAPVRVQGLPSLRAFRDSFLSRMGDGRERSPLSVAFVT